MRRVRVTSEVSSASVRVYLNGVLHLAFARERFLGLASWQWPREGTEGLFYIEIALAGGTLAVDYDSRELWVSVLAELARLR